MANNDQNNKNGKGRNNLRGILTLVAWALVLTCLLYTSDAADD